jgi:hypothetical protein
VVVTAVVLFVHVIPSGDVTMFPLFPTATKNEPFQITQFRLVVAADVLVVHAVPSGEVSIVPLVPTIANNEPFQAEPSRVFVVPDDTGTEVLKPINISCRIKLIT